jgi:multidrug resistance efflux pump
MEANLEGVSGEFERAMNELTALRQFPGAPKEFWPKFLAAAAKLTSADITVLLLGHPGKSPRLTKLGEWAANQNLSRARTGFTSQLEPIAERALREGSFMEQTDEQSGSFTIAVRLKLARAEDELVLAAQVIDFTEAAARESLVRLNLISDTASLYQANLVGRQAASDVEKFANVLDLLVPVNEATRFVSAALAFCNGLATRFRCERVSLGWLEGGYIHLRAMSRTEQFDRKMAAAQAMEKAMEECLDQDEEILWPTPEGANIVARDHEKFAAEQKTSNVCSLPLRLEGKAIAVLTCERQSAFTAVELQQLRLCCDQVVRRLSDLKRQDRWFGARWAALGRERFSEWLGPERTWSKIAGISGAVIVILLFLVRVNYRVEGNFILRSDEASYLTAPFDGYIDQVFIRTGDHVDKGGKLVSLNRSELLLEESAALADLTRYQRESEKSRAAKSLAEMRIADALAQQAQARLDLVRYRLENAIIKSPFEGVVVEGDLRERIAAPVKQGDALYKVARIDTLYAEAEVKERDVKEILGKTKGEIAFVSQPKSKYAVTLQSLEPSAITKKDGNVFLIRLKPEAGAEAWWRPGMTGLCKISTEKRSLFWILTHRTVDFLRMKLWW